MKTTPLSGDMAVKLGLAVLALGLIYLAYRKVSNAAGDALDSIGEAASNAASIANQTIASPVLAIGEAVGIPQTSTSECERAMAEGRTWDASFACPATTFIKYMAAPKPTIDVGHSAYWKS
jgi:hypothetical protein